MGTVPSNYTWLNNEIPTFRDMNAHLSDMANFLLNPPMVRLRRTGALNITNNSATTIPWDLVEYENTNMWDATAPTKLKPSVPGWYIGTTGVSWVGNATGYREMDVKKNGSTTERVIRLKSDTWVNTGQTVVARCSMFLEVFNGTTDYVEVTSFQNSGGTLATDVTGLAQQPDIAMRWFANV